MPHIYIPSLNPFRRAVYGYLRDPQVLPAVSNAPPVSWIDRDRGVEVLLAAAPPKTSGDVDLRPFCTHSSQGPLSSCVGNATADAVEICFSASGKSRGELSRLFVYAMARVLNGDLHEDAGTHIRSAFEALSKFGICAESIWPYLPQQVHVSPSLQAQQAARGQRIHSYYRIKSEGPQRVADAIAALRAYKPVVFGTLVDQAFRAVRSMAPVGVPRGNTIGGHAMVLVGYQAGNFIVKNSWGEGWGDRGFWAMSPEYFAWRNTWDIWVPTLGSEFSATQ